MLSQGLKFTAHLKTYLKSKKLRSIDSCDRVWMQLCLPPLKKKEVLQKLENDFLMFASKSQVPRKCNFLSMAQAKTSTQCKRSTKVLSPRKKYETLVIILDIFRSLVDDYDASFGLIMAVTT